MKYPSPLKSKVSKHLKEDIHESKESIMEDKELLRTLKKKKSKSASKRGK